MQLAPAQRRPTLRQPPGHGRDHAADARRGGSAAGLPRFLQGKLAVGPVDDPLEHAADATAERGMRMPEPAPLSQSSPLQVGRKCAACEEEVTTGKTGAPLADKGPWLAAFGNGGPEAKSDASATDAPQGGSAVAATPPKLTKKTVSGPTAGHCGAFKWVIQWELDKKTSAGGWVVQKLELAYNVKDCNGNAVDPTTRGGPQPSWFPFWEAWQIHKDQQVTTYAETGDVEDDTYGGDSPGDDTKGYFLATGTAEFYDGLRLPSSFKVTNKPPQGILPTTKSAPTLSGGTGAISHNVSATWDCCSKEKTATKDTTIAAV